MTLENKVDEEFVLKIDGNFREIQLSKNDDELWCVTDAFRDIISNLKTQGFHISKWLPIETAPRDGTGIDILLNGKSRIPDVNWGLCETCWVPLETWLDDLNNPVIHAGDNMNKITHWMPIAPAPKKEQQ